MNSIKKMRKKNNTETAAEENARLEYASLYDDDAGPTEEEKKQMQLEAKEAADYRKKILIRQRMLRLIAAVAATILIVIVIYSLHHNEDKAKIASVAIAGTSASVTLTPKLSSANSSVTAASHILISDVSESAQSVTSSSASTLSSADILSGISHGDYHIYDPNAPYQKVNETVTSSGDSVNLRTVPSTENDSMVIANIQKGQVLTRTGIGKNGWSRLSYNGETVYAVTGLLSIYEDTASAAAPQAASEATSETANAESSEIVTVSVEKSPTASTKEASTIRAVPKKDSSQNTSKEYTIQTGSDSKSSTIWQKGKKIGTMHITNENGATEKMLIYDSYYYDKKGHKYLNIYIKDNTSVYHINADNGYIDAMNEMNCSGIYLNKSVYTW